MTLAIFRTKHGFAGGVHPPEHKSLAAESPVEVLPTPAEVRISLLQHLGAICEPTRKPRDEVTAGDLVGEAQGFVSAPVHTSVSGKVGRAAMATLPNGRHVPVVRVTAAEEQPLAGRALWDDIHGGPWLNDDLEKHEPGKIAEAARNAGLVGLGGAAFPTHVKLTRNEKKPIHTLLINGCECEPYLTADYRLMVEAPEPIVAGALLARRATGAQSVEICVEDNKPEAVEQLRKSAEGTDVRIRVLKTKYPQGSEKQLILAAQRAEVPLGGLPLDVGVVVMNVGTAAALARAVLRGKPLTHRIVTVSGSGIRNPKNLLVPVGATYGDLIDYCGGLTEDAARVVAGGPMMGFTLGDVQVPVTKGTSGVTVLTEREIERTKETTCVRCGRCVQVCPMRLVPAKLAQAVRSDNLELLDSYHITGCMECGSCAFVCPAGIPLVQLIRIGKVKKK
ncbi:MAG: electron transport complex subunit RsxC [Pirellulales bacterium]|nr:electron transport complex subunit RsxC [Pirellulales bacterium]